MLPTQITADRPPPTEYYTGKTAMKQRVYVCVRMCMCVAVLYSVLTVQYNVCESDCLKLLVNCIYYISTVETY